MRIMHVVESFGGGVFTVVCQMCNVLADQGFDVHLVFSKRVETPDNYLELIHPLVHLHQVDLSRDINLVKDMKGLLALYKELRTVKPDVVHFHSSKAGFLGRVSAWLYERTSKRRLQVYYSPHGFSFLQSDVGNLKKKLFVLFEKIAYRFGGTITACSLSEATEARQKIKAKRVEIIENAVNTASIPIASSYVKPTRRDIVRIGIVGRITTAKNPELFASLAKHFLDHDKVKFIWIGGTSNVAADKNYFDSKNIEVTGWLARDEALKRLADLDIYLQTSLWEGLPVAVIEAMVAGIPAVVTDVHGNRDLIEHGYNGFISKDKQELIDHLQTLINDEELRKKFGARGRESALERFSIERLKDDLLRLYNKS